MDILNFISWLKKGKRFVTQVDPAKTLIPVGLKDDRRDDDYLAGAITVEDLASQVGYQHYIGEEYGGGVIFHVYKDANGEEHGLVVSIEDQSTSSPYSNISGLQIDSPSTWNGLENTNKIKAQPGATSGAWKDCDDYIHEGFSDWYLPAVDEFKLIYQNRFNVNKTLSSILGASELLFNDYWTSTQQFGSASNAFIYFGGTEIIDNASKNNTYYVRAIRQF